MKKHFSIFLVFLLIFSFIGCTGGEPVEPDAALKEQMLKVINGEFTTPKNVIIVIGDGMGANDIKLAEEYAEGVYSFGLVLNQIPNHGLASTYSANSDVTDSAASGTALSTGVKTNNGYIGMDQWCENVPTMAEIAREAGKKIGIITDEDICGATPSAFVVHNISRDNRSELASDIVKFKPDVLMSMNYGSMFGLLDSEAMDIFMNEYVVAKDFDRFPEALKSDPNNEKPFWGFLIGYTTIASDNLAQCTEIALNRLKNENGFFLMVESAGTDKFGHGGDMQGKLNSVVNLDRTVATILKFMEKHFIILRVKTQEEILTLRVPII